MKVTQEDRNRAAELFATDGAQEAVRNGFSDNSALVQAFAAHREAAEARVVEWLRAHECSLFVPDGGTEPFDEAADAIARGEHLKG